MSLLFFKEFKWARSTSEQIVWHPTTQQEDRQALFERKRSRRNENRFLMRWESVDKKSTYWKLNPLNDQNMMKWWRLFFCSDYEEGFSFCSTDLMFPSMSSSFCLLDKTKDSKLFNHMPSRFPCLLIWTNVHLVWSCQLMSTKWYILVKVEKNYSQATLTIECLNFDMNGNQNEFHHETDHSEEWQNS